MVSLVGFGVDESVGTGTGIPKKVCSFLVGRELGAAVVLSRMDDWGICTDNPVVAVLYEGWMEGNDEMPGFGICRLNDADAVLLVVWEGGEDEVSGLGNWKVNSVEAELLVVG